MIRDIECGGERKRDMKIKCCLLFFSNNEEGEMISFLHMYVRETESER